MRIGTEMALDTCKSSEKGRTVGLNSVPNWLHIAANGDRQNIVFKPMEMLDYPFAPIIRFRKANG